MSRSTPNTPMLAICGLLAATPALAAGPAPAAPATATPSVAPATAADTLRYSFVPVDGGALKLDRDSGKVSFCGKRDAGYLCEAVPDTRDAYEDEIGRLQTRITELERQVAGKGPSSLLPDREDVSAALDYASGLLRRLKTAIEDIAGGKPQ